MAVTIGITIDNIKQLLCYDEKNPMIFHDIATAFSYLKTSEYANVNTSNEELEEMFEFKIINE